MRLLLVGMNHRTAPLPVREHYAVGDAAPLLEKLVASEEIEEAVIVSTCNRVEVVVSTRRLEAARHRLRRFFEQELAAGRPRPEGLSLDAALYEYVDSHAIRHVFRVASSIDSMVVGEPQILGQLKDAYRAAVEADACRVILNRLFHRAFATAKRVRGQTGIATRPISVARVAVDLSRQIFETLEHKTALLVGAGEMIEMALEALRGEGLAAVRVANRTAAHARELATRFDATAHGLHELPHLVAATDVLLTSIASEGPLLDVPLFERALAERRRRPVFVVDIGLPRNVDPDVARLDGVYVYDLDDLAGLAEANAEDRRRETVRAEAIVQAEVERFDGWLSALQAVPTIRHLRARAEWVRRREIERAAPRLALSAEQRDALDVLTRAMVNKLLHAPVTRLREETEREEGLAYLEAARVLFALDDPGAPGAEADAELSGDDDTDEA